MRIAVFGGSRGVGKELLPQAVDRDWGVKVLARQATTIPETPGVQVEEGNVLDPGAVFRTLNGCDAAVITLGKTKRNPGDVCSEGTRIILEVMKKFSIMRVVAVTAMGLGDTAEQVPFVFKLAMKTVLKKQMVDKARQEALLFNSDRDWVIVRPGGLTDGEATGNYRSGDDRDTVASQVSRADVAAFVLDQVRSDTWLRRAVWIT